jgi:hypothetical protein
VSGLSLAVMDHPPALHVLGDEGVGVGVAGLRHVLDGSPGPCHRPAYWATPWAPGPMHKWKHLCPSKRVNSIDQLPQRCSARLACLAELDEVQPTRASLVLADEGP